MKVFISWSGGLSKGVAELLKWWLKAVLQATEPWISSEDIDKGSVWFGDIGQQIKDTSVGIICLTPENLSAPWILFEAGGLARGPSQNRVCSLLIGVSEADLKPPLSQFHSTKVTKDEIFKLVQTINACLGAEALDTETLKTVFETFWPNFERDFEKVTTSAHPSKKQRKRSTEELLDEILTVTRENQRLLQKSATVESCCLGKRA